MPTDLHDKCRKLLIDLGIASPQDTVVAHPLSGGVASDIAMVSVGDKKLCVKFALPKLKVQADWFAPVHRNAAEYAWLEAAASVAPEGAIALYGQSRELHGFAMEYLDDENAYLWKTALLNEAEPQGEAAAVGDLLGRIHATSTKPEFDTRAFQNRDDFQALRIEPYLLYTASQHEDIAAPLQQLAKQLYDASDVLVHGDVSPKNIFFRAGCPVMLDAECATMGDASFDLAFCLNHIVLKAIHLPASRQPYLASAAQFWHAYSRWVSWEPAASIETRVCRLLPALMLARVDGKSPVEYLSEKERTCVRELARQCIKSPVDRLSELLQRIGFSTQGITS